MEVGFLKCYRHRKINHHKLHQKILNQFREAGESVDKMRNYDEILFVLDERSPTGKAARGVCDELFNQTKGRDGKTSISKMTWAYIENLQTAKLCLLRDQNKLAELKSKTRGSADRSNTFVHLQIIQVSVYSRFTKDATLSYSIQPSDIPSVSLQKAINPILNHEFTFRLDNADQFSIIFMDSGISIGQWTFPDQPGLQEGQYHRLVTSENVTFQVKIKYLPRNSNRENVQFASEVKSASTQKSTSKGAFENLVTFEPFLNNQSRAKVSRIVPVIEEEPEEQYEGCMSFLGSHVRNLFVLLIALILAECFLSYYSAAEFLDIMLAFYVIGILYNRDIEDYEGHKNTLIAICIGFIVLTIKGFWGMANPPFYNNEGARVFFCVICTILEILVIIALAISVNNLKDTAAQRNKFFYDEEYQAPTPLPQSQPVHHPTEDDEDIYEEMTDRF